MTVLPIVNSKLINWETMKHHGGDSKAAVDAYIFNEHIWMLNKVASYLHWPNGKSLLILFIARLGPVANLDNCSQSAMTRGTYGRLFVAFLDPVQTPVATVSELNRASTRRYHLALLCCNEGAIFLGGMSEISSVAGDVQVSTAYVLLTVVQCEWLSLDLKADVICFYNY